MLSMTTNSLSKVIASKCLSVATIRKMTTSKIGTFNTLLVSTPKPNVYHVQLHRPKNLNAFNREMWSELKKCIESLSTQPDCRAIVLSAAGKHYTAGLDLTDVMGMGQKLGEVDDVARKAAIVERSLRLYQESITSLELCPKPVIAAIHSACVGAGVNLITAADVRYCSEDAFFQLKEVQIGMAADVGALQRLPKAIGSASLARELCFTGRRLPSAEAFEAGLVSKVFLDKDALLKGALELAEDIAQKSPVAVQATKRSLVYSQSRPNQDGLDHIREINKLNLLSEDFVNAATSQLTKSGPPEFPDF